MQNKTYPVPPGMRRGDWLLEVPAVVGIAALIVLPLLKWSSLPEKIPTHFGFSGEPDSWGAKWIIWLLPGIGLVLYGFLTIAVRFPHRFNYPWPINEENAQRQYALARTLIALIKIEVIWLFAFLAWRSIEIANGNATGLSAAFLPVVLVVLLGTVTWYLVRAQSAR